MMMTIIRTALILKDCILDLEPLTFFLQESNVLGVIDMARVCSYIFLRTSDTPILMCVPLYFFLSLTCPDPVLEGQASC